MKREEWIETKKECEVMPSGELVTKKVTLERAGKKLENKDIIDISLRFIGLAAIFIPLWLFFQQQQLERDKQKALYQLNIYSNTATELHALIGKPLGSAAFEESKNKIYYELYPRLILLNPEEVMDTFNIIKNIIEFSSITSDGFKVTDSFYTAYNACLDSLAGTDIQETDRDYKSRFYEVSVYTQTELNNCLKRFAKLQEDTRGAYPFLQPYQKKLTQVFTEVNGNAGSAERFCTAEELDTMKNYEFRDYLTEHLGTRLYALEKGMENARTAYQSYYTDMLSRYITRLDSTMIKSNILLYNR